MPYQSFQVFVFLLLTVISHIQSQSQCIGSSVDECTQYNPKPANLIPLFHGRCCLKESDITCSFVNYPTPGKIKADGLKCGTGVEECNSIVDVNQNANDDCYSKQVELPYKCCYIGYRSSRKCVPLDVSNKQIYSVFEAQFRAIYGLSPEDKLKIKCGSNIIKAITGSFTALLFTFLL